MNKITNLWRKNAAGKLVVAGGGFVTLCCACSALLALVPTPASPPGAPAGQTRAPTVTVAAPDTPDPTATPAPTDIPPTPTPQPADTATPTAAESVEQIARKHCGGNFRSAKYADSQIEIECKLQDGFSDNLIVAGAFRTAMMIARDAMSQNKTATLLRINVIGDFTDKYGKDFEFPAFAFSITRNMADKVQWDNINQRGFARLVIDESDGSKVTIHSAWRDNVRDWLAN